MKNNYINLKKTFAYLVPMIFLLAGPLSASAAGPAPVNVLSIATNNFTFVSKTGITNTGSHTTSIVGNIGASPVTAAAMNNVFCSEIAGTIYGVDAAYVGSGIQTCFAGNPPLANKTLIDNAVLDMGTAYADAAGRTLPDATELNAGALGGLTIAPGLYKFSTNVSINSNVTLNGGPNDVWIFQIAGDLNVASAGSVATGVKVKLAGGAKAKNIFWQVGGSTGATLGTYSTFAGTILSAKQTILQTGAVLNGRALAQTQITLDANTASTASLDVPSATTSTAVVILEKFIDGAMATSGSATGLSFPMFVSWNATNIGAGSGSFDFTASGFNGDPTPYQAITSPMTVGASYTASEVTNGPNVGASCSGQEPFALVGYSTGASLALAAAQAPTTTVPNFTNLQNDQFIIVWNKTCKPPSLTIVKRTPNGAGTFNFSVTSTTTGATSTSVTTVNGSGTSTPIQLTAGTYTVLELAQSGWIFSTSSCVYDNQSIGIQVVGGELITIDRGDSITCTFVNSKILPDVTVTIVKEINGVHATAANASSTSFTMLATWNATNIGAGSGTYALSTVGFNSPNPYEAVTSNMTAGASYSTNEDTSTNVVGPNCGNGQKYQLVGYTTGDSLAAAQAGTPTTTIPSFTNITTNKFVIVWNAPCGPLVTPANACSLSLAPVGYTLRYGTTGNDSVTLAPNTMFIGLGGNDAVMGPDGNYIICLGSGTDSVKTGNGISYIDMGSGNNSVITGSGSGTITGGSGNDSIRVGNGPHTINAGDGINSIITGDGDQLVTTGNGDDSITTGSGNDTIQAGNGNNSVKSNAGNDTISTGSGNDVIDAGAGNDSCSAGGGINVVTNCNP